MTGTKAHSSWAYSFQHEATTILTTTEVLKVTGML
jgi:hypothetical protein